MTWKSGSNKTEDAGPSKQWRSFVHASKETPDESKAVIKSNRGFKRDMMGHKPNNTSADDGNPYKGILRAHRESSPTRRHGPLPQDSYNAFYLEEDRRRSSSSSSPSPELRQHLRFSDQHRKSRETHTASMSIDPSKAEDATLHLSLPTAYDIEDALEEAARLRRIGHFKAAIEVYERNLGQFLESKYVMVQYAECLLDAGQISKFSGLNLELSNSQLTDSVDLNWAFMKLRPDIQTSCPLHLQDVLDGASKILHQKWPRLDSTEVQLLTYSLDRLGNMDWYSLYRHFCNEYMIWEFHDLFVSMVSKLGLEACWRRLFPWASDQPTSFLEQLDEDWPKEGTDVSVNFALLDILTTSGLQYLRMRGAETKALECLKKAGEYAALLRSQDTSNIKSRPYLRWMVAKAMLNECPTRPWTNKYEGNFYLTTVVPGFIEPSGVFPAQSWPLYVPLDSKSPAKTEATNFLRMNRRLFTVAEAAEEIGDLLLRTACFKELVLNGAEGIEGIMEKLEELWTESGYADSISQMHLYQYLLIQEPSDVDKVRRRILLDGETSTGWAYYVRCRVMAALATSERERDHYQHEADDYDHRRAARYRTMDLSRPQMGGYDSQGPHRSSGGREQKKSPNFLRPSEGQKRNGGSQELSLQTLRPPRTLASTGPLTPKRLALKEQEQDEIIRSREKDAIGKWEEDAIGEAAASSGKMTDLIVTKFSNKNPVSAEHEDEDAKSDETQILRRAEGYGDPEDEDLPRRIGMLLDEKAELESTHTKEGEEDEKYVAHSHDSEDSSSLENSEESSSSEASEDVEEEEYEGDEEGEETGTH